MRRPTSGGGWMYWVAESGETRRTRVSFFDISEDSSGLGFTAGAPPPDGTVCWAVPDGGKGLPCEIRNVEKIDDHYRVGSNLDFQDRFVSGQGGCRLQWLDAAGVLNSVPANLKNSGQALIEISMPENVPARTMVYLEGPQYGCLGVCRGARPDGSRFILVVEAASDSFVTGAAAC
ncbi:MAG: hypothetical protein H6509_01245 [Bryobacterales bacterium]|nr:hypothetical protein [Bryobacterales bacterium]